METDTLLVAIDSQNISTSSQNLESHDESDPVPEETNEENNPADEIKEDDTGFVLSADCESKYM